MTRLSLAQEATTLQASIDYEQLPEAAQASLEMLHARDADLRDLLRGIGHQYDLNLAVDNRIERRVTVRLADLPIIDALVFLCQEYGLQLSQSGSILRIERPPEPEPPPPPPLAVTVQDSLLSVDLQNEPVENVVRAIVEHSDYNIVVRQGVTASITGLLEAVPLETGLRLLMHNNGLVLRKVDGIYQVDRAGFEGGEGGSRSGLWVQVEDSLITLDVAGAPISDVLREVVTQVQADLITYATPEGILSARADGLTLDETLNLLFRGTNITYRKEGSLYIVGDKQTSGIASSRLIRLGHIRADAVLDLIPQNVQQQATIQIVKEHNGLMVTGTNDVIVELEEFVREIDHPTPQILIEALVVDFQESDMLDLGIHFGFDRGNAKDTDGMATFGTGDGIRLQGAGRSDEVQQAVSDVSNWLGVGIGKLPEDFYFRIRALSQEGKANVRSRPQVATLNGHSASITIGTTQYYILETATPYQSTGQVVVQETQRFEKIEANVKLDITPWVSASGEVTAEIRPEFSTPVGELNPEVPPTINTRILESTVRLQDGETIILGGLIQEIESVAHTKVPFLGSIPLLGRLFRTTKRDLNKAELVIFLTPHVFYGDGRDEERWNRLRDELDLSSFDKKRGLGFTRIE